jgi:hypothetical protein
MSVAIIAMMVFVSMASMLGARVSAAPSASIWSDKTVYLFGEKVTVGSSWSGVYVKSNIGDPAVFISYDGMTWLPVYAVNGLNLPSGSTTRYLPDAAHFPAYPALGPHTLQISYATGWDKVNWMYIYASKSCTFNVKQSYTVSGNIWGRPYDGTTTTPLSGATIYAKQELGVGGPYTGIVYTATSGSSGSYSMVVADGMYHFTVTRNDYVTSDNLDMGVGISKVQDFTLRCQWKEYPQPRELRGVPKDEDAARIFTRDVNGDGVIDSVNFILDTNSYLGSTPVYSRPANTTYWIELRGYTFSGSYQNVVGFEYFAVVTPSGPACYYPVKEMVLYIKTNLLYGDSLLVPKSGTTATHVVNVVGLALTRHPTRINFCYCGERKLESALTPFNMPLGPGGSYGYFYSNSGQYSNWPWTKGDGTDLQRQMAPGSGFGCPNTLAFYIYAQCYLGSWPQTTNHAIIFNGEFQSTFNGLNPSSGLIEQLFYTTLRLQIWGYYIMNQ